MTETQTQIDALRQQLRALSPLAVAVSGGVDSMTLAVIAGRLQNSGVQATMLHAVSPAVPPDASARVRRYAERERWQLRVVDAGEFNDAQYRANPANRCFFCKSNLYGTMSQLMADTVLASGTNTDDLGDYRPGLQAAENHQVRHPYVEANIDKQGVRAIARYLDLDDLAELPSAPCLSSRIETGIAIAPDALRAVDAVEKLIRAALNPRTVRCRVRQATIEIELDNDTLAALSETIRSALTAQIAGRFGTQLKGRPIAFSPYRMGSAFLRSKSS